LFGKYLSAAEKSIELQKEQKRLDEKKRIAEIKPRIKKAGCTSSSKQSKFNIKNAGGIVKVIEISKGPDNNVAIPHLQLLKDRELEPGVRYSIEMNTSAKCSHMNSCIVDIILILEDEDNNKYQLHIKGNARNPEVSDLIEFD